MTTTVPARKSFWQRPEGKTGAAVALVGLAGAGWLALKAIPLAILAMQTTLHLTLLAGALGLLAVFALDRKTWVMGGLAYKLAMRKLTGWFVTIDPIGQLEEGVARIHRKLEQIRELREQAAAQQKALERTIRAQVAEGEAATERAQNARARRGDAAALMDARVAERRRESAARLVTMREGFAQLLAGLDARVAAAESLAADMADEVKTRKVEREAMLKTHSLMHEVRGILAGGDSERELFEQAMEYVVEDYGKRLDDVEAYLDSSAAFMESVDVERGAFDERALAQLEHHERIPSPRAATATAVPAGYDQFLKR